MKILGHSDIGNKRKENQDAFYIDAQNRYAVIADGMGGEAAGEIASNAVISAIKTKLDKRAPLKEAIQFANEMVFEMAEGEFEGMGSTVVIVGFDKKLAQIASVGDSRAYLLRGDDLKQITTDHSMVNTLLKIGKITENQIANHPQKNLLTRAIGTDKKIDIDTFELELAKGDMLLLCTDGLTNAIADYEIKELLKAGNTPEQLCKLASKRSGKDNCTVIVASV
ncbi:MAG: Stp1/IreP family PP2C-type Ser/Thr phosphatase [Oscillospiraceae bacterium]|nr:Stp1/IreP family PP2C-type Ser/Thr phosphatase [Oscillospiraceae bacterium]